MKNEKQKLMEVNGKSFYVDETIYDLVLLLNKHYKPTIASCSGHGNQPASIIFDDETELRIMTYEQARIVDKFFPNIKDYNKTMNMSEKENCYIDGKYVIYPDGIIYNCEDADEDIPQWVFNFKEFCLKHYKTMKRSKKK